MESGNNGCHNGQKTRNSIVDSDVHLKILGNYSQLPLITEPMNVDPLQTKLQTRAIITKSSDDGLILVNFLSLYQDYTRTGTIIFLIEVFVII